MLVRTCLVIYVKNTILYTRSLDLWLSACTLHRLKPALNKLTWILGETS